MRELLAETVERILKDLCTPTVVRGAEDGTWPDALWRQIEEAGLPVALVPESDGGAGLNWHDVLPVLVACGQYAAPVPLGEAIAAHGMAGQRKEDIAERYRDAGALRESNDEHFGARRSSFRAVLAPCLTRGKPSYVVGTLALTESEPNSSEKIAARHLRRGAISPNLGSYEGACPLVPDKLKSLLC